MVVGRTHRPREQRAQADPEHDAEDDEQLRRAQRDELAPLRAQRGGERGHAGAVLDAVVRELHERRLEARAAPDELVDAQAVLGREIADPRRRQADDRERAVAVETGARRRRARAAAERQPAAGALEQRGERDGVGRHDAHVAARRALRELGDARVGDEPAAPDDEHVVGRLLHLAHEMARHEDRAALGGEALQQRADPADALGVEAVHRLVEQQRRRVAEQRGRDAEALRHAEREAADAAVGDVGEPDLLEHLVDAAAAAARPRRASQRRCWRAERLPCDRLGVEQRADLAHRRVELAVAAAGER